MKKLKVLILPVLVVLLLAACQAVDNESTINPASITETVQPAVPEITEASPIVKATESENYVYPPGGADREFSTDFSRSLVDFEDILSGGPPKDGIPSIDNPVFISITEADKWLQDVEPVIQLEINGEAKAYPIQILMWHEIVNDTLGGVPVMVSFCPLCNTAIVYERTVNGRVLDFGTTGRLRYSNLILYDRQTETWWQQAEGRGIIGTYLGEQLQFLPASILSWEMFKQAYPQGLVLSSETGFSRNYGQNPYVGYDTINQPPFLYRGPAIPDKLEPVARILALEIDEDTVAYPYDLLNRFQVVNDRVGDVDLVVIWSEGTASALDRQIIAEGKDVGTAAAYNRLLDGTPLTFSFDGQNIIDDQTGSTWNIHGRATSGEYLGEQLSPVVSVNHFWFSWVAFKPDTRVYQP